MRWNFILDTSAPMIRHLVFVHFVDFVVESHPQTLSTAANFQYYSLMTYFIAKTLACSYDEAIPKVTEALKAEGFGVLTEIDVRATLKKKLDVDFRAYCILGACNPPFAHRALLAEPNVGLLLPCNVVVQEAAPGTVNVSVIDPVAAMQSVENPDLAQLATEVREKLERVIEGL